MRELLDLKIKDKKFLIAAHRGTFGANVLDNTYLSMRLALELGADLVEADVIKSKDGVLYAFHSGLEHKRFGKDIELCSMNSEEIDKLEYLNLDDLPSGRKVEKLEDILKKLKGDTLINIDRAWDCFPEVFTLIRELNMENQIIVKSPHNDEIVRFLKDSDIKLMFMPILKSVKDLDDFIDEEINLVAVELLFDEESHELNSTEFKNKLKEKNIYIWVNSIKLDNSGEFNFVANHYDDNALENEGETWKWLIDQQFDIIQTDWPYFLNKFRNKYLV